MNLADQTGIYIPEKESDLSLLPCPFCGCETVAYMKYNAISGERWAVVCMGCIAEIDPGWAQQRHQVQPLWNKRVNTHGQRKERT